MRWGGLMTRAGYAGSEYVVETEAHCENAPVASWAIDRDVRQGEAVRALSTSSFSPSGCASSEKLEVRYLERPGPSARSPHLSVIVGAVTLGKPTEARGTR